MRSAPEGSSQRLRKRWNPALPAGARRFLLVHSHIMSIDNPCETHAGMAMGIASLNTILRRWFSCTL